LCMGRSELIVLTVAFSLIISAYAISAQTAPTSGGSSSGDSGPTSSGGGGSSGGGMCPASIDVMFDQSTYTVGDYGTFWIYVYDANGNYIPNSVVSAEVFLNGVSSGLSSGFTIPGDYYESTGMISIYLLGDVTYSVTSGISGCSHIGDSATIKVLPASDTVCYDTDGGSDYDYKGTTFGRHQQGAGPEIKGWWDECMGDTLIEYSCSTLHDPSADPLDVWAESKVCANGCANGACLYTYNACTDSDYGQNYNTMGTTCQGNICEHDYCLDQDTLFEMDCGYDGNTKTGYTHTCSNGCSNGVCLYDPNRCNGFQYFTYIDQEVNTNGNFKLDIRNGVNDIRVTSIKVQYGNHGYTELYPMINGFSYDPNIWHSQGIVLSFDINTGISFPSGHFDDVFVVLTYDVRHGITGNTDAATCTGDSVTSTAQCTDSDSGIDYRVRGWVSDSYDNQQYYDYCTLNGQQVYSCSNGDPGCGIQEKYCDTNNRRSSRYITGSDFYLQCTYGCENGACAKTSPYVCSDSDGGIYPNIKGTTTSNAPEPYEQMQTDYCLDKSSCQAHFGSDYCVNEASCHPDGLTGMGAYECPNGCNDGACIETTSVGYCGDGVCSYGDDLVYNEGDRTTQVINGVSYSIDLVAVNSDSASIEVNGEAQTLATGTGRMFGDLDLYLNDVCYQTSSTVTKNYVVMGSEPTIEFSGCGSAVIDGADLSNNGQLKSGDTINKFKSTLTSGDLPSILAPGTIGTTNPYNQRIYIGNNAVGYGNSGGDWGYGDYFLDIGDNNNEPLYIYQLDFTNAADFLSGNLAGETMRIMGQDYTISSVSTNSRIELFGSGVTVTLNEGESTTIVVGGVTYDIILLGVSQTGSTGVAIVQVNDVSDEVNEMQTRKIGGVNIYAKDVYLRLKEGQLSSATLQFGADRIILETGKEVKKTVGSDDMTIDGTYSVIQYVNGNVDMLLVYVFGPDSAHDYLRSGQDFEDPVWGGFSTYFENHLFRKSASIMIGETVDSCPEDCATQQCTDSDGGKDYYEKGEITEGENNGFDSCNTNGQFGSDPNMLMEYFCDESSAIAVDWYSCPNGCKDGACIASNVTTCTDSDGGDVPFVKGEIIVNGVHYDYDYCITNTNELREYVCYQGDTKINGHTCENGCQDGACIMPSTVSCGDGVCEGLEMPGMSEGETANVMYNNVVYDVRIVSIDFAGTYSTVIVEVNGVSGQISEYRALVIGGLEVYVKDMAFTADENGYQVGSVILVVGESEGTCPRDCQETPQESCKDSDGNDYYRQGTCSQCPAQGQGGTCTSVTDTCFGENTLVEYVCDQDYECGKQEAYCQYGCQNGACVPEPPQPGETFAVTIKSGWNLISLPAQYLTYSAANTCQPDERWSIWWYYPPLGKFINQYQGEQYGDNVWQYVVKTGFWVYSPDECTLAWGVTGEYYTADDLPMLYKGWNMVMFSKDMVGRTIEDVKGDCKISRSFVWNEGSNSWQELDLSMEIPKNAVGHGWVARVEENCNLGSPGTGQTQPPGFPTGWIVMR
jgi:hypothetical protein